MSRAQSAPVRAVGADALALTVLVLIVAVANWVWMRANLVPPHWDQAIHLMSALRYRDVVSQCVADIAGTASGIGHCARTLAHVDQSVYAPLFPLVAGLFSFVVGRSATALAMTNVLFLIVLVVSMYGLGRRMHSPAAGLLAAALICAYPLIFTVSREFMLELALVALTAAAIWLLVESNTFAQRPITLLFGVVGGLAVLTKFTVLPFLVGPTAWMLVRLSQEYRRGTIDAGEARRRLISLASAGAIALLLASTWYWPNWDSFAATLRHVTALDTMDSAPWRFDELTFYASALIWDQLGPILCLAFVLGLARLGHVRAEYRTLLLVWIGSIYLACTLPSFKAVHNDIGILIPVALISATGIASLPRRGRSLVVATTLAFAVLQLTTFSVAPRLLAQHIGTLGWRGASKALPQGERWPLDEALRALPAGETRVAVLSDHRYINGTTAQFLVAADRLPFEVAPCWTLPSMPTPDLTGFDAVIAKSDTSWVRTTGDGCFLGRRGGDDYRATLNGLAGSQAFALTASRVLPDGSSLLVYRRTAARLATAGGRP